MKRNKRNQLWFIPKDDLKKIIDKSNSVTEVLKIFGLRNVGNNFKILREICQKEGWDYSKITNLRGRSKPQVNTAFPIEQCLVENSNYCRSSLKRRVISLGLLENKCSVCNLLPEWQGKVLSLQLDHINGIPNDNRIENLRIICPNCHSQTSNFAGKKLKKNKIKPGKCSEKVLAARFLKRKVVRPSKEELSVMLWQIPTYQIGIKFGVSDNAVSKWAKNYGLEKPPRGYWAKLADKK